MAVLGFPALSLPQRCRLVLGTDLPLDRGPERQQVARVVPLALTQAQLNEVMLMARPIQRADLKKRATGRVGAAARLTSMWG
jgi:hypothetical protein